MEQFMMPPGGALPGEVPPAIVPTQQPDVMLQSQVQEQVAKQGLLQEEGAQGPSKAGDGFFDKLRTDPKLAQSMLMVGLRMMQGQRPGQDAMGMVGDAMMAGAAAHNMLKYNEGENARKDQELALKTQESGARVAQANANTAATQQATQQSAAQFPNMQAKLAQEVKNLRAQGKTAEAQALIQEARSGNIKTELDLENAAKRANINQSNAAAGASAAQARYADQGTQGRILENEAKLTLMDRNATETDKEGAGRVLGHGRSAASTKLHDLEVKAQILMKANEGMDKTTAYKQVYEDDLKKKGQDVELLKEIMRNAEDPKLRAWAEQRAGAAVGYGDVAPGKVATPTSVGLPAGIPAGSTVAGKDKATGKTVYRDPTGKLWTE